jgi:hypothetical protein
MLPHAPLSAVFTGADAGRLERELATLAGGALERRFEVSDTPHRALCSSPARGGRVVLVAARAHAPRVVGPLF